MLSLLEDLRFGWRALRKRPVFALTAISALALGIGANTAIFSVLESLLLRPLPYEDPEQLVMVYLDNQMQGWPLDLTSYPNYEAWRDGAESLQDLAAFTRGSFSLTGDGDPERLQGASVGGSFFSLLGTLPLHGRWIGPAEDVPGADAVAVLSHDLFERRFGGDDSILGQQIQLDGQARTVIGVMPPRFEFPKGVKDFTPSVDLWVPMAPSEATRAVISTGRSRRNAPSRIASSSRSPSMRSLRMKAIITTPLSTATPDSAMNPTPAEIDSGRSRSHKASTPPVSASGTPLKITRASRPDPKAMKSRPKISSSVTGTTTDSR